MLSVTFPVAVGVLLALAAPSARRELLRRAARCFGAIVAIVAAVAVFPAAVLSGFVDGRFATSPVMAVVTYGTTVLTFLWVVPFMFWGIGLALVHVFRTADIHETVPPLLAMALVWEMTLVDLFTVPTRVCRARSGYCSCSVPRSRSPRSVCGNCAACARTTASRSGTC